MDANNGGLKQKVSAYMTVNTFIVIFALLAIIGAGIYFYQTYREFQKKIKDKESVAVVGAECPDYWEVESKTKNVRGQIESVTCRNVQLLGKCALAPANTFSFSDEVFKNPKTGDMARCKWAKQCNVAWSGYDTKC